MVVAVPDKYKTELDLRAAVTDDVPRGRRPVFVVCPYHDDHKASLAVYPDGVQCFACGANRAPLQFLAYHNGYALPEDGDKVRALADRLIADGPAPTAEDRPFLGGAALDDLAACANRWAANPLADAASSDWLQRRGVKPSTMHAALLGHTGRAYSIPIYDATGALIGCKFRRDDTLGGDGPKYWAVPGTPRDALYYPPTRDWLNWHGPVVVTEGEFDALALASRGVPAVTAIFGVKSIDPALLCRFPGVVLCLDQDEPGRKESAATYDALRAAGVPAIELRWNAGLGKDACEMFGNGNGDYLLAKLREAYALVLAGIKRGVR